MYNNESVMMRHIHYVYIHDNIMPGERLQIITDRTQVCRTGLSRQTHNKKSDSYHPITDNGHWSTHGVFKYFQLVNVLQYGRLNTFITGSDLYVSLMNY